MSAAAPDQEVWPFLVVLMQRRTPDEDNSATLVPRGLGWRSDGHVYTLTIAAQRGDVVVHPNQRQGYGPDGRELSFAVVGVSGSIAQLAVGGDDQTASVDNRRAVVDGESCVVAIVRDHNASVRLMDATVRDVQPDGRFEVQLAGTYPEDSSAGGSPVIATDGAVIGICHWGGTGNSVGALGIADLTRLAPIVAIDPGGPLPTLSATTRSALTYALQLIASGGSQRVGVAGALLLGLLRSADDDRRDTVLKALLAQLGERDLSGASLVEPTLKDLEISVPTYPPEPADDKALYRSPIVPTLGVAEGIRFRLARDERLRRRFLLAAVLRQPPEAFGPSFFDALGFTLSELREGFRDAIASFGADRLADWDTILQAPVELDGGIAVDRVDPNKGIPLTRDHLGVGDYVRMFATVIADTETPMPLSIGLFGEWGSGKSYFMGLLRGQVAELAGSDARYHREIVQIGFNAWHYADSNLWASLGDEIFEQLAGPGETNEARRERLREELGKRLQRRKELDAAAKGAEEEIARLRTELDDASSERSLKAQALVRAVLDTPQLEDKLKSAMARIGVDDEVEQGRLLAAELADAPEDLALLRRTLGARWIVLLLALAVIAVAAVSIGALWSRAGGVVVFITGVVAAAGWLLARARSGVRLLHEVAEGVRREKAKAVAPKLAELRRAEAQQEVLQSQLDEVTGQVGQIGRELADLNPGQRLYSFIADTAAGDSYSKQLGLISTIRKDFEELIELMKDWRKAKLRGEEADGREPIDRIVLYIDDLDRCSSEQVVEVLQAVHLLLALDLFIVVVGVDPRWLLHALRREYRSMLTSESRPVGEDPWWETTPQDYLEKIFNIPFTLTRMNAGGFEQLVRSLAETETETETETEVTHQAEPGAVRDDDTPSSTPEPEREATIEASSDVGPPAVEFAELSVEEDSQIAALRAGVPAPAVRALTGAEVAMLTALAPLVETPREAKRILNLYRMIRATRNLSPTSSFLGDDGVPGDYQAVVILLGLLSGHARMLESVLAAQPRSDVLGGLRYRDPDGSWADFVSGIAPRSSDDGSVNDVIGAIAEADVSSWQHLSDGLGGASELVTIPDLRPFQRWAPRIARFSFLLSPYARDETSASAPARAAPTSPQQQPAARRADGSSP